MFRLHLGLLVMLLTVKTAGAAPARPAADNFYERLGVAPTATTAEIKRAYRQAMLRFHPDRGGSSADATRLSEAYQALTKAPRTAQRPKPPPHEPPRPPPPPRTEEFWKAREAQARARREAYQAQLYKQLSEHFKTGRQSLRRGDVPGSLIMALRLARGLVPMQKWEWPGAERAGLDFFNDYIWVQLPAKSAAAFRAIFELWRTDGLARALSRILLSNPSPADLRFVRAILDRREFFDPSEDYTAVPLTAWADAVLELDRQSWGTPILRQEFAPRFVAILHWRYVREKNSARGLAREAVRNGVPQLVGTYWKIFFGSWTLQKMKDWANPHPPFPTTKDFCSEALKTKT